MDFLSYVVEVSRRWDEPQKGEVGKMKSQPSAFNVKAGMYTLNEDDDMKAKFAVMTRRLEELELKKMHEVQAVAEAPVQSNNNAPYGKYLQLKLEESSKFLMEGKSTSVPTASSTISIISTILKSGTSNSESQQDNLPYSISRLTNLNTVQEKGRFPSQPHQNPNGIHEVEIHEGESSQVKDVKALITLRSGKKVEPPTPKPHEEEEETKKRKEMKGKKKDVSEEKEDRDSTVNVNPGKELIKEELMKKTHISTFSSSFAWEKGDKNASEILEVLRQVKVNIPLLDMIKQVPTYAKFLNDLCTIKRGLNVNKKAFLTDQWKKALLDLGASVNLLPYSVYKQLGLDFVVLDTDPTVKEANSVPIILGRPFLATSNAIINCRNGLMQLTFGNMTLELTFFICLKSKSLRKKKKVQKRYYLPISDSPWVSPTQVVPKKSGITVVQNEKGEEIATRLTSGWRESLAILSIVSWTGTQGIFKLKLMWKIRRRPLSHVHLEHAYRRMPFGLCNAPATFQRCMLSIFSDMVERIMEVFMDDITIYGGTFEECLVNLEAVLKDALKKTWCSTGRNAILWSCTWPKEDGKPYVIYYASKTLNEAQRNYTTTEKELLAVQDAKARLIRWILLLQEFDLQIRDKKGVENVESLMLLEKAPWYAHIANYLVTGEVPSEWNAQDRKHFFAKIHAYYWEEPFLFKYCADQIIRKCVPEEEQQGILSHCHENTCGGHFASQKTAMKVLQSGFTWPSLFKDAHIMCRSCDRCQRLGKLTKGNQMPMNPILIVDLFYVWGIDFMGPFPMSFGNSYILVGVDYVSKWVKAIPCKHNDHRVVLKFLKENIFSRFGVSKAIISDGGTHFCNKPFETLLAKYGVKHKVATPYHPQTSGQVELTNREIKNILMKVVITSRKD
ncbi:Pro-Pol polyprotein [Vitis vinifera]|uniref:Pro-Pol polyprotein n=1 Tax=Vitis vinifera TaxID=29760 RepID=A0A438HB75_VITVI|nr:Pro-Pol polyprotein [Vitis vinifera]